MKSALALILSGLASTCMANVSVNWSSPANAIKDINGNNAPATWIAQLIYSPDNVISPIDPNNPFVPTEGELVFASKQLNSVNSTAGVLVGIPLKQTSTNNALATGFVYTRVFNVDFNGGNPSTPTHYGNSNVVSGPLQVETTTPSTITNHASTTLAVNVNQEIIVPEPSTYAFLGMGVLLIARRLRNR